MVAFGPGDSIRLGFYSSVAETVKARFRVRYENGVLNTLSIPDQVLDADQLADGFNTNPALLAGEILAGVIFGRGTVAVSRGQLYATAVVVSGESDPQADVASGYVYLGHPLRPGEFVEPGPSGGQGNTRSVRIANPAAGVELSQAVPTGTLWRFLSLHAPLTGGAAAFNSSLIITDGTSIKYESAQITVGGGASERLIFADHELNETGGPSTVPVPPMVLPAAYVIETEGITADDDYDAGELLVEEWVIPN